MHKLRGDVFEYLWVALYLKRGSIAARSVTMPSPRFETHRTTTNANFKITINPTNRMVFLHKVLSSDNGVSIETLGNFADHAGVSAYRKSSAMA